MCADSFGAVGRGEQVDEITAVVQEGDVLIAATDGVLDNLFDDELQMHVASAVSGLRATDPAAAQEAVDQLAQSIAARANEVGMREDEEGIVTPFMQSAAKEGLRFVGGKLDDVAVVCAVVRSGDRPAQRIGHNFQGAEAVLQAAGEGLVVPTGEEGHESAESSGESEPQPETA